MQTRWLRLGSTCVLILATACSGSSEAPDEDGGGGGPTDTSASTTSDASSTSSSTTSSTGGGNVAAGITGCDPTFVEDGVCRPTLDKCPAGTLPNIDDGCVGVGIETCASSFLDTKRRCDITTETCPIGTFAVPSLGCVSIDGDAGCGEGPFGTVPDAATNVYVDPAYAGSSSDGTKARPFTSIDGALAAAPDGATLVLAKGTYAGPVHIGKAVGLRGACASEVTLTGASPAVFVVEVDAGDASILRVEGVSITGDVGGIRVSSGEVTISGTRVHDVRSVGVYASGADTYVAVEQSSIDGVAVGATGVGYGVANTGAELDVRRTAITHTAYNGATFGGPASLVDVFIGDVALVAGSAATCVANDQSDLTVSGLVCTEASSGVWTWGPEGSTRIERSQISGLHAGENQEDVVRLLNGADVSMESTLLVGAETSFAWIDEGTLRTRRNLLIDAAPSSYGGYMIREAGRLESEGDVLSNVRGMAVSVLQSATLSGSVIEHVGWDTIFHEGEGVLFRGGTDLSLSRVFISDVSDYGVVAFGASVDPAFVSIEDSTIERILAPGGHYGAGIAVTDGISLDVSGALVHDVVGAGVQIGDADATIVASRIHDVRSGNLPEPGETGNDTEGMADGIVFHGSSSRSVTVDDTIVERSARAAVTLREGNHRLTNVKGTESGRGLVLIGAAVAEVSGCTFAGNADGDVVEASDLPVPESGVTPTP